MDVWIILLKMTFLDFPRYSGYIWQARWTVCEILVSNFFKILHAKNYWNQFIFDRVIRKIKGGGFSGHGVYANCWSREVGGTLTSRSRAVAEATSSNSSTLDANTGDSASSTIHGMLAKNGASCLVRFRASSKSCSLKIPWHSLRPILLYYM